MQTPVQKVSSAGAIDYTPDTDAVVGGDVIVVGDIVGVAPVDIAVDKKGAIQIEGVYRFPKITGAIGVGVKVYWAASGNPVGGDAGSGAATTTASGNKLAGYAVAAAASGDATVDVVLARA